MKETEIRKLIHSWLVSENQEGVKNPSEYGNYKDLASSCYYSLIENFTPDCPGWCGTILTVVFGYAECIYTFTIEGDKLKLLTSPDLG